MSTALISRRETVCKEKLETHRQEGISLGHLEVEASCPHFVFAIHISFTLIIIEMFAALQLEPVSPWYKNDCDGAWVIAM